MSSENDERFEAVPEGSGSTRAQDRAARQVRRLVDYQQRAGALVERLDPEHAGHRSGADESDISVAQLSAMTAPPHDPSAIEDMRDAPGQGEHAEARRPDTAVLDVDGTLVDTNYHHALAWYRAFRRFDETVPVWRLHRAIGMGGDQLVTAVAGERFENEHGEDVRACWAHEFQPMLAEVQPFDGVRDLLVELGRRGLNVVLASSGAPDHVDAYLDLFDGRDLAQAWTTSEDVDRTKPEPNLLGAAVDKVGGRSPLVIGDSVWDFEAAGRAGYVGYAIRTGGFSVEELLRAGAREVFDSVTHLHERLDDVLPAAR